MRFSERVSGGTRSLPVVAALAASARRSLVHTSLALVLAATSCAKPASSPASEARPSQVSPDIELLNTSTGQRTRWGDLRGKKGTVLVFTGLSCPVALGYERSLKELGAVLKPRGINVVEVNANDNDAVADLARHTQELALPAPVYKDPEQRLARTVGVSVQSESVLLDQDNRVLYRGRIDDRLSIAVKRSMATRHELLDATDALVSNRRVAVPVTDASGCGIAFAKTVSTAVDGLTYVTDVAPILERHCAECHRPHQIGPMPLLTYKDVSAWSDTIRDVIEQRRMPPWDLSGADHRFGDFANARGLSDSERDVLLRWIREGTPRGNGPEPTTNWPATNDEWAIGQPDLILELPQPFAVPALSPKDGIPYQHFVIYQNEGAAKWVEAVEVRPGIPSVVHHAGLLMSAPGVVPLLTRGDRWTVAAPGRWAQTLPAGMARSLPAGARLELELHYTPDGVERQDRTRVAIRFAKTPPRREVMIASVGNTKFEIPPNTGAHEVKASFRLPGKATLCAMVPHMHFRGSDFRIDATLPDGATKTLLFVPHYDYNWQHRYVPKELFSLPEGTVINETAHFDNSRSNPSNPNPSARVAWGEQSWDEMMYGFIELAYDEDIDSPQLSKLRQATKEQLPARPTN
jgi:hypothetical protein